MNPMIKKIVCVIASALVAISMATTAMAATPANNTNTILSQIEVTDFDSSVDYTAKIAKCLEDGGEYAMEMGAIYETQRNMKIEKLGLDLETTNYFSTYTTAAEIKEAMEEAAKEAEAPAYSDEDLYWLSRVVFAEAGCSWFPDWVQRDVASVVLNRVADSRYPSTIKDVIFDPYQYSCVDNGSIYRTPTQKCIDNARYVLENGSTLPSNIIGQSAYAWGPVYKTYTDSILGTTIKFFSC